MVELTAESVESAALTLQSIDDVHGGDGLSLGVLGVGDGITDDILEEDLEDAAGLFVDEARDTFDTASTRETTDGGLGDTLDVITQHFAMTFGTSLSEALSSFAASRHCDSLVSLVGFERSNRLKILERFPVYISLARRESTLGGEFRMKRKGKRRSRRKKKERCKAVEEDSQ